MRLPDQVTLDSSYEYQAFATTSELGYVGYEFSDPNELVEGDWEIQAWYQGQMLFAKTFSCMPQAAGLSPRSVK